MDPTQIQPGGDPSAMPPAPGGNEMPPQGAPAPGGDQPVSDEQKQALLQIIQQIKSKIGTVSATTFAANSKTEKHRHELLVEVFQELQSAGVDLSDRDSVAQFMSELQATSPELAANFEKAMEALLGETGAPNFQPPTDPNATLDLGVPPQNNMNIPNQNETLPQGQ